MSAGANEEQYELEDAINDDTNGEEREKYTKDAFASREKNKLSYSKEIFCRVEVYYVDTYMLGKAEFLVKPTLELSESITRKPLKTSNVEYFAPIYLNRNWYILVQEYINYHFDPSEGAAVKNWEIIYMMKIWILQFYYGTTSTRLFDGKDFWYAKTKDVSLTKHQYMFIIKKLVSDLPALDIY